MKDLSAVEPTASKRVHRGVLQKGLKYVRKKKTRQRDKETTIYCISQQERDRNVVFGKVCVETQPYERGMRRKGNTQDSDRKVTPQKMWVSYVQVNS